MTVRKRNRKNRYLGHRTHGAGNSKNRRGAGNRGGKGRAGSHKHKFNLYAGTFGTERPKLLPGKETRAINLDLLVQLLPNFIEQGKAEKTPAGIVVDGGKIGFDKVLGKANVLREKLVIKNLKLSKKASERVLAAGGKIESSEAAGSPGEGEEDAEFEAEEGTSEE
ncbi:MAG: uL15 family ribosomal protein [Candidatus ainarchaeum sp.]|nr:uL15 family ribosomal protein [Candidatus ainarchaeum sp.]